MTWTYDATLATNRDKVRVLIGDYDSTNPLLSDEELCFLETEFGGVDTSIYETAVAALDVAIAGLARKAESKSVGPLTLSYANRISNLQAAWVRIEEMVKERTGAPINVYAGGISRSDKIANETEDSTKSFRLGQMDTPGGMDANDDTTRPTDIDWS